MKRHRILARAALIALFLCTTALAQVEEDLAPPSTGCGNVECEVAAACATADPGFAVELCATTVRKSQALRAARSAVVQPTVKPDVVLTVVPPPADAPLVTLPDGSLAKGLSVKVSSGAVAPFAGYLIDPQEHTRRERINTRNAAELADYKSPGNATLTKGQLIAIVGGAAVAGIVAGGAVVGVVMSQQKRP